jgi:hypothetical protein
MRTALGALGLLALLCGCTNENGKSAGGTGGKSSKPVKTDTPATAVSTSGPGGTTLDGPYVHENLAVYVVRGKTTDARDYITLTEGLAAGSVTVREKGAREGQDQAEVNALEIENRSDRWLFIQAGDVVKGGKQDRTIGIDVALEPHSKPKPVNAFCVEHGRWVQKAGGLAFGANTSVVSSNSLKMSIQGERSQGRVWEEVAKSEQKAARVALAQAPAAQLPAAPQPGPSGGEARQASSIPTPNGAQVQTMTLSTTGTYNAIVENDKISGDREAYVKALLPHVEKASDGLGLVVAVNGKILAADIYGSSALFGKISRKLVESYALEAALSCDPEKKDARPPSGADVLAFLAEPAKAAGKEETLAESMHLKTRETGKAVLYEYRDLKMNAAPDAAAVHQNFLAK